MITYSMAIRPLLADRLRSARLSGTLLVWFGLIGGAILLAYSYSYAARHRETDQVHFHLFWIGELLFFVPALLQLCGSATPRGARLAIVVAAGAFDYAPKYLRNPHFPLFLDELLHSRQLAAITATGRPFQPSAVLSIIQFFPGLHMTTASFEELSGASPFVVQSLLLLVLHVVALVGVFVVAEAVTLSDRAAGLAAFAYSLNPSFLFFDTQFAYESLGIVLFIWTIAALARAERAAETRVRIGWVVLGVLFGCACVVTHHLSSYVLTATLLIVCLVAVRRALSVGAAWSWKLAFAECVLAIAVMGAAVTWLFFVASNALGYLAPHFTGGLHQVVTLLSHEQQTRTLFAKSTTPLYERDAAFLSPPIAFAGCVAAMRLMRYRWSAIAVVSGLRCLAVLYFASLPFIYTQAGNEGARRSWGFTYLGVSVLLGIAVSELLDRPGAVTRTMVTAMAIALGVILYVGNVSTGVNAFYRFPGPPSTRSEIRVVTPELRSAAAWFARTQGPNQKIVADQYSTPSLAFFGSARPPTPSAGFPTYELYLSRHVPRALFSALESSRHHFLFVNGTIPLLSAYYKTSGNPPGQLPQSTRTARGVIARYDRLPWAIKLYASNHLAIYRIDFGAMMLRVSTRRPTTVR